MHSLHPCSAVMIISFTREAARQGADMIECDMALTNDNAIICSHAPYLGQSTDISTKPEFANRLTTYNMDDDDPTVDWNDKGNITDWFSFDFSLEELRSLRVKQVQTFFILAPPNLCFSPSPMPHCQNKTMQLTQLTEHIQRVPPSPSTHVATSADMLVAMKTNFKVDEKRDPGFDWLEGLVTLEEMVAITRWVMKSITL